MSIRSIPFWVLLIFYLFLSPIFAQTSHHTIRVAANEIISSQYKEWVGNKPPWQMNDFTYKNIHRGTVELILMAKALKTGGIDAQFSFLTVPNYSRALAEVCAGNADLPAESIWRPEADKTLFYVSDPIFRKGEIELGLYVSPANKKILKAQSLEELEPYSAVSSSSWIIDWELLGKMNVKRQSTATMKSMYKMIGSGRADFLITSFTSKKDFANEYAGVRLIPIPNIKVALDQSRHFVVLKKITDGEKIFKALQAGLKSLREEGIIHRAFEESGYFDQRVKQWKRIYP